MYAKTTTVENASGLHARPAAVFTKKASEFASKITVKRLDTEATCDAKSVLMLMGMGIGSGTQVEISPEGDDEQAAVDALVELVESGCGE
ncbi:HPr family phosphocarrier protein [uncultured Enorma sp.]|uniref:HPr family phosphocarrier protein n=1 Tax=uncultured Enorma sp. TaxID=1714346 RepID=UPI002599221E|nr:HPr family phosphocarrier protein [uncultured Enorma sp.]